MPYKDPEQQAEATRRLNKNRRESLKSDPTYLQAEAERKAEWYKNNKETKANAQRAYRARLKVERDAA